jgi:hypothetical protein
MYEEGYSQSTIKNKKHKKPIIISSVYQSKTSLSPTKPFNEYIEIGTKMKRSSKGIYEKTNKPKAEGYVSVSSRFIATRGSCDPQISVSKQT